MMSEMRLRRWGRGEVSGRENWEGEKKKTSREEGKKMACCRSPGSRTPSAVRLGLFPGSTGAEQTGV